MHKLLLLALTYLTLGNLYASSIGVMEKGKLDKFENAYAIVTRGDKVIPIEKIGFEIQKKDQIKTFRRSNLQIRLNDNTIIKIGKKTTLKIEDFFYNKNSTNKNKVNVKVENGSYQIKTGKVGNNFKLKTKFSTIGLRG